MCNISMVPFCVGKQHRKHIGFNNVISVHKADVCARRTVHSRIACTCHPPVALVDNKDPIVPNCPAIQKFPSTIGRAVVYDNNLQIFICLTTQALQASGNVWFDVISGNYNANPFFIHYSTYPIVCSRSRNICCFFSMLTFFRSVYSSP